MDIKSSLIAFINDIGPDEAAELYNRKPSTVRTWLKSGNFPIDVVQKFMDDNDPNKPEPVRELTQEEKVEDLGVRMGNIEAYLAALGPVLQAMQTQTHPGQPRMGQFKPTAAWIEPDPTEQEVQSFINPAQGIAPKATFKAQNAPAVQQSKAPPGLPSAIWLKPRPRPK